MGFSPCCIDLDILTIHWQQNTFILVCMLEVRVLLYSFEALTLGAMPSQYYRHLGHQRVAWTKSDTDTLTQLF